MEHFLKISLGKLQSDYVDLLLIHFPVGHPMGKDDDDLHPRDENGKVLLSMDTDLVAVWKVR